MKIQINTEDSPFAISTTLLKILQDEVNSSGLTLEDTKGLTFVFKDESYSSESGGFHPVEIRLVKVIDDWRIDYITDFAYVGNGYDAELTKEIDFDFTNDYGFHLYSGEYELRKLSELYELWESNFIQYFDMGIFKTRLTTD